MMCNKKERARMKVITLVAIGDKTKKAGYNIEEKHTKQEETI